MVGVLGMRHRRRKGPSKVEVFGREVEVGEERRRWQDVVREFQAERKRVTLPRVEWLEREEIA